jgi:hypothetical protein
MKATRKTVIGIAVATALAAAAGTTVFAHGGGYGPGYGPTAGHGQMMGGPGMMGGYGHMMGGGRAGMGGPQGMMFGDHAAYAEQRLENFRTQLNITPEQEAPWNAFADTLRAQATAMNARHQAMAGARPGFTEHFAHMQAGAAQMGAVAEAAQALYAALSPEQQARADSLTTGGCWR